MRVAVRRMMRVGITQSDMLDDLGVKPDVGHATPGAMFWRATRTSLIE